MTPPRTPAPDPADDHVPGPERDDLLNTTSAPAVTPAVAAPAAVSLDGPSVQVRVPQADGEIRLGFAGDEPLVFPVTDHTVSVTVALAPRFVAAVGGSSIVEGTALDSNPEE